MQSEARQENESLTGGPPGQPDQQELLPGGKKLAATALVWEAYSTAYLDRYGTRPVRNAMVNGQLANILTRIPRDEAPEVAAFYVRHNSSYYVAKMHSVGAMQSDIEKLRTEWATGRRMLGTTAREVDRSQHNADVWDRAAARVNDAIERRQG